MKHLLSVFVVVSLCCCFSQDLFGQWSGDSTVNSAIAVVTGNQTTPSVFSDGAGGALITWTDSRSGNNDAYAQLVNASGVAQWTANGVVISAAAGDQNNPMAVPDGSGGYIIAWWDTRNSSWDIYAQRINSSGVAQWTADGVPVCTAAGSQTFPMLVPDGSGGAIITWADSRNATTGVYAQRINGSGVVQWTADGIPVCSVSGVATMPNLISDGSGGAIIAWTDARGINYDIYAQRINGNGDTLWTANGVLICGANAMQRNQAIISDSAGGAIIVWEDHRNNSDWDIYAQRINASGAVQWTADGVILIATTDDQTIPVMVSDGGGGAIVAWSDFRTTTNADIYAQRINSSGVRQWGSNGIGIVTLTSGQSSPAIAIDGAGGAIVTWDDFRNGNGDIYAQRINGSGTALWNPSGIAICTATGAQDLGVANNRNIRPIISDGSGGAIVVWSDPRSGSGTDVYAQWVSSASVLPVELVSFVAHPGSSQVALDWTTATESNSYGFEIERKAVSSGQLVPNEWIKVGFVAASGSSNTMQGYSFSDKSVSPGSYSYRLKQVDKNGTFKYTQGVMVEVGIAPKKFTLSQNYPNPFNPTTTIEFTVPQDGRVTLKIVDMLGRDVATLFDGETKSGYYQRVVFDASKMASGVYFSKLEFGGKQQLKKMILMK